MEQIVTVSEQGIIESMKFIWERAKIVIEPSSAVAVGVFVGVGVRVAVGVFVDGMKHEEVAEVLGISRRTVSRKLERFLDRSKRFLGRYEP